MKPEEVVQYLVDHPDFFNDFTDVLVDLQIPHPQQENVISLHERQAIALRDKNQVLQDKLLELISFGEENDAIGEKMHRLTIALLTAYDFEDLLTGLSYSLREDFDVPSFVLRLWGFNSDNNEYAEFSDTNEDIRAIASSLTQPYCGNHVADGIKELFLEEVEHLQSFAMIPINTTHLVGLLVLGSPESERFYADMGTLHLKRLGDLIGASIARCELVNVKSQDTHQSPSDGQSA